MALFWNAPQQMEALHLMIIMKSNMWKLECLHSINHGANAYALFYNLDRFSFLRPVLNFVTYLY